METDKEIKKPKAKKKAETTKTAVEEVVQPNTTRVYLGICVKTGEKLYKEI